MRDADRLAADLPPPGSGASFAISMGAELARIEPLTERAAWWLRRMVSDEASWDGSAAVLGLPSFAAVAEAAKVAGFTFERDARSGWWA